MPRSRTLQVVTRRKSVIVVIWLGIQVSLLYCFSVQLNAPPNSDIGSGVSIDRLSKYNVTTHLEKVTVPDNDRVIAFLHIGKTGGSTITANIRQGCHEFFKAPCSGRKDGWTPNETIASKRISEYYHMVDIPLDKLNKTTTIVTTVRNPISRFISAFAYDHPINANVTNLDYGYQEWKQFTCFPTLSHLVKAAMGRPEIRWSETRNTIIFKKLYVPKSKHETSAINCNELAVLAFSSSHRSVIKGIQTFMNHMTFDYRQYYRSMPSDKEIFVIRYERLWEDFVQVNHLLGENPKYNDWPAVPPFRRVERNVSHQYTMKERWKLHSRQEQRWLCHLLRDEIRTYLMIIMRSVNLNEEDLYNAVSDVDRTCEGMNVEE